MVIVKMMDFRDGRLENVGCDVFGPFDSKELANEWVGTVQPGTAGYGPTVQLHVEELEAPTLDAAHEALHGEVCPVDDQDCDFPREAGRSDGSEER